MEIETTKISVILRTYNSAEFVQKALGSIAVQTLPVSEFELVCVDDGSTDNTIEILETFASEHQDINLKIVKSEHGGAIRAINTGINNSTGQYIVLLDSDDNFEPLILENLSSVLDTKPEISFVYCDYYEKTGEKKKIVAVSDLMKTLAIGVMFRKDVLDAVGPYDESLILPEYDIILKANKTYTSDHIAEPHFTYNRRDGSITADPARVELAEKQLRERHGEIIDKMRSY
jgi:glycosyltransferase involved in cell wall biosynthesis